MKKNRNTKWTVLAAEILFAVILMCGILFVIGKNTSAPSVVKRYWAAYSGGDYKAAYKYLELPRTEALSRQKYVDARTCAPQVQTNAVSRIKKIRASEFAAHVKKDLRVKGKKMCYFRITYHEIGGGKEETQYVAAAGNPVPIGGSWKLIPANAWLEDVRFEIPTGSTLKVDGADIATDAGNVPDDSTVTDTDNVSDDSTVTDTDNVSDDSTVTDTDNVSDDSTVTDTDNVSDVSKAPDETAQKADRRILRVPYLFCGGHEIEVAQEGMKTYHTRRQIGGELQEPLAIELAPDADTLHQLSLQTGSDIRQLIESAWKQEDFETVGDLFAPDVDARVKQEYENLKKLKSSDQQSGTVSFHLYDMKITPQTYEGGILHLSVTAQCDRSYAVSEAVAVSTLKKPLTLSAAYTLTDGAWKLTQMPVRDSDLITE